MKIFFCAAVLFLFVSWSPSEAWKTAGGFSMDWPHVTVESIPLGNNLTFLHGSGANMCLLTGADGNLLVDCEFPQMSPKIKGAISQLNPGPVRFLINTHWHGDHTGGNADFGRTGTVIVAQDQVLTRMSSTQFMSFFKATTPPSPPAALPTVTYDKTMTLHYDGENVLLFHEGPAHTDGDTVVYFPKANVVHMGDLYINGLYPIIDLSSHGTIEGYFPYLDRVLGMINDRTRVIPGHGPLATKKELQFYRDMLATIRDRVKAMIVAGKNLDEITASSPSREFDADWASDRVGPKALTKMIYESLKPSTP